MKKQSMKIALGVIIMAITACSTINYSYTYNMNMQELDNHIIKATKTIVPDKSGKIIKPFTPAQLVAAENALIETSKLVSGDSKEVKFADESLKIVTDFKFDEVGERATVFVHRENREDDNGRELTLESLKKLSLKPLQTNQKDDLSLKLIRRISQYYYFDNRNKNPDYDEYYTFQEWIKVSDILVNYVIYIRAVEAARLESLYNASAPAKTIDITEE